MPMTKKQFDWLVSLLPEGSRRVDYGDDDVIDACHAAGWTEPVAGGATYARITPGGIAALTREALLDASAHLVAMASAYAKHAARSSSLRPKARPDPFFETRSNDFSAAASRAQEVLRKIDQWHRLEASLRSYGKTEEAAPHA